MALRAGVAVADLEFVQFHPTALHHPQMPRPLLSEALRGHGALLRDARGERFVDELAPRDVVSRAMARTMLDQGVDHLWLDATGLERFALRFPTIASALDDAGLDPATDWLPIAPAAHYTIGGVVTDLDGATALPGLWAAGEVACTGVHGANRLASNSLLEGMVFSARVVEAIEAGKDGPDDSGLMGEVLHGDREPLDVVLPVNDTGTGDPAKARETLQRTMTAEAGVVRNAASLERARAALDGVPAGTTVEAAEARNLFHLGAALVAGASAREESRGAHTRSDFPSRSPEFERHLVAQASQA
jgi:L-aspartate oxidase